MDINNFIAKVIGDWFSQRTTYNIQREGVENSKANITISILPSDSPEITALIKQGFTWYSNTSALLTSWDNSPDWGKAKQQGKSLMLIQDTEKQGKIWRLLPNQELLSGTYSLGEDQALTFRIDHNSQQINERIWFGNDNLRFRNTTVKNGTNVLQTCFYSEIKKISPQS